MTGGSFRVSYLSARGGSAETKYNDRKKTPTRGFSKIFPPALNPGYLESEKKHSFIKSKYDRGNNLTNIQYSIRGSYHCQMNFNF